MNKYQPHIFVLPEDDANRQIANGFLLDAAIKARALQVLEPAGGWSYVVSKFENDYIASMRKFPKRRLILLLDFDEASDRLRMVQERIPDDLKERVFVIGVWSQPEKLRNSLGVNFEPIGLALAKECREDMATIWNHALLKHNASEVERMKIALRPILFP